MLVGLGLLWTSLGTFNINDINRTLRDDDGPAQHGAGSRRRRRWSSLRDPETQGGRGRRGERPAAADRLLGADAGRPGDLRRLRRQECPVPAPRLAPRRDGRADAGLGADPRGDDGGGGRLPGRPVLPAVHARRAALHRLHRRDHAVHRGDDRDGADRLQEGAGLFDREPARLHDARPGRRRLGGGPVPPAHARVLQGPPVPRGGQRLSRRAHLRDARTLAACGGRCRSRPTRCSPPRWRSRACRSSAGSTRRTRSSPRRSAPGHAEPRALPALRAARRRRDHDGLLHVPDVVPRLRRRAPRISRPSTAHDHGHGHGHHHGNPVRPRPREPGRSWPGRF